jgi:osmotically-inducible protein OsmY
MHTTTSVHPPQRPDAEILDSIRIAVDWQLFSELALTVVGGIVTIDGNVDSWSERRNLDTVVRQIDGVRNVVNHLTVRAPPIGEVTLRIAIEQALARRAMREARRIDLAIAGARVTVIGTVRSFGEHDAVIGALISTPSVESIDDQLEVQGLHPVQ